MTTKIRDARSRVQRLESELSSARAELTQLQMRRSQYDARIEPVIESARDVVSESIVALQEWRARFRDAVDSFSTDQVGELGRDLVEVERKLFYTLHNLVSTANDAKARELGVSLGPESGVERVSLVEPAAREALKQAGGDDPRLAVWSDVKSETGQRFRDMILSYCKDQRVRVYHPRGGLGQFRKS